MNEAIFQPGQLLAGGRYRIERLLGEGGMGAVYQATELTLERTVALKVLLPELSQHPTARHRMEAEAKAMARIRSPHVVGVNTIFDEGGLLVIDLEYLSGGSLADLLEGYRVEEETARVWIVQILKGIEALHSAGLVHRDLKPTNVLIDEHGALKVTDLGIAQDSQRSSGFKTRHDANLGTAEYMAPEQVQSAATVDARADLYAAGIMLCEFLTGNVPFRGTEFEVKVAHVQQTPDLSQVRQLSGTLAKVVERALAKDPAGRYSTAREMREAVEVARSAAVAPATEAPVTVHKNPGASRNWIIVLLAIIALLYLLSLRGGTSAAQKLQGKWTVDLTAMAEMDEIKKMPEDQRKAALEMAKGMMSQMTFEFTADKISIDMMGQKKEGTYKVKSDEGNKVVMEGTMDGKTETLEATFKGDGMILGNDEHTFPLKRK